LQSSKAKIQPLAGLAGAAGGLGGTFGGVTLNTLAELATSLNFFETKHGVLSETSSLLPT